ncbi:AAA family ATPase [Paraburkholderia sp. BCC1885]|uniref:AAA family ATPase n=1 Tax=Paraburkholderia sp. BCC1885 TaxID=2562669 RepID=UPI00118262AE|nr:AAA family ATPase [Paraburkholderia sp. BCC1885]
MNMHFQGVTAMNSGHSSPSAIPSGHLKAASGNSGGGGNGVELVPASEIPMLPILWLWKFWLARGKFHILAGPPATGKTTLAIAVGAAFTIGGTLPDGTMAPVGTIVIWTCEDSVEDTVMPRLAAAGADLRRVLVLYGGKERGGRNRTFDFETDLPGLEAAVTHRGDVVLIIIDSIAHAIPASNNNSRVRKALDPLVALAERTSCAILGLTHVNKGSKKKDPLDRINGSVAIGALSRIAWVVARDESGGEDGTPRSVLVRAKSNLGPVEGGFAYHIDSVDVLITQGCVAHSSKVTWDGPLAGSPREILGDAEGATATGREDRKQEATAFLASLLAGGPKPVEEIGQMARDAGLSWATVRRASAEMGMSKFRPIGMHHWCWALDNRLAAQFSQPGQSNGFSPMDMPSGLPFMSNPLYAQSSPGGYPSPQMPHMGYQPAMQAQYPTPQNGEQLEQVEQLEQAGQLEQVDACTGLAGVPPPESTAGEMSVGSRYSEPEQPQAGGGVVAAVLGYALTEANRELLRRPLTVDDDVASYLTDVVDVAVGSYRDQLSRSEQSQLWDALWAALLPDIAGKRQ